MERKVLKGFFVIEGIDGAGTTTQLALAGEVLAGRGVSRWLTCEPGTGAIGKLIRRALGGEEALGPVALAALFAADRAEHLWGKGGVEERIAAGDTVVCDRYLFSSLAYQGMSCGAEIARAFNLAFPLPEALFFLDIDPARALERISGREAREIYEDEAVLGPVAAAYRAAIESFTGSGMDVFVIDATLPKEDISRAIADRLPHGGAWPNR